MDVACKNEECSELDIIKSGPDFPIEEIQCGKCGGPVEEVTEDG